MIAFFPTFSLYLNCSTPLEYKKEKVPCITLDDFVYENNLEVGLIKADVEGCEKQLILGARLTDKKCFLNKGIW